MKQNKKKHKQTLESAQYGLEISFNLLAVVSHTQTVLTTISINNTNRAVKAVL